MDPEGWGPPVKFMMVLESPGLNASELGGDWRARGLFPEQVAGWRPTAQDADLQRRQQELRRKDKALAEAAALLKRNASAKQYASKKIQAYWGENEGD